MTEPRPQAFRWTGEVMEPLNARLADEQYVVGEVYRLAPHEPRSRASHSHYMASVAEAWRNLPEALADRFPSPDALRRWALIKRGYCTKREIICASEGAARALMAYANMDEYSVAKANGEAVTIWRAESQAELRQNKARFQRAKNDVLDEISNLIGVSTDDLKANAKRAA